MAPSTPERRMQSPPTVTPKTVSPDRASRAYATPSPVKTGTPGHGRGGLFADYNPNAKSALNVSGFALPQSPALPDLHPSRSHHVRTNSDVQGLVKRFEHLDVRDRDAESQERRRKHEAELRRAQIAREEAETDVKRLRVELRALKKEHDESRDRERKMAKRLEVVMEEHANAKEAHAAGSGVYEKELRKIRKEAFKSSSTVVKLQEELKSARSTLRVTQSAFDLEKQKVQRREQETFDAQYQFVALQEEVERVKAQLLTVQEEKEALKTSLREEEVARIAAEGMIALPASQGADDDLLASPRKMSPSKARSSPPYEDKENLHVVPRRMVEYKRLEDDLAREQRRREHAEEMCDFLSMECMFRCCGCHVNREHRFHGYAEPISQEFRQLLEDIRADMAQVLTTGGAKGRPRSVYEDRMSVSIEGPEDHGICERVQEEHDAPLVPSEEEISATRTSTEDLGNDVLDTPTDPDYVSHGDTSIHPPDTSVVPMDYDLSAPAQPEPEDLRPETPPKRPSEECQRFRTVTTTTKVPILFTPSSKAPAVFAADNGENVPPPVDGMIEPPIIDRAAALAAIQYRRGRARSLANGHATPRKQMIDMGERRDVSAPTLGMKANETRTLSGSASVGRGRPVGQKT